MKKFLIFLFLIFAVVLICYMVHLSNSGLLPTLVPPQSTQAVATSNPTPSITAEPTPDPRNEEVAIRAEIASMLRDARELLQEGYDDDASKVLRDLRTRNLTDVEKAEVDTLQASMVAVSD
ncbi:MAG: hypothetical protein IKW60_03520 [Clostridia bacterium]|nr:hypothetical protein [Clostridia bacterium]